MSSKLYIDTEVYLIVKYLGITPSNNWHECIVISDLDGVNSPQIGNTIFYGLDEFRELKEYKE